MSTLTIKKVELDPKGKKVKLTFEQLVVPKNGGDPFKKEVVETIHQEPDDSLVNAFLKLIPHAMFISQLIPTQMGEIESFIDNYQFTDDARFKGVNVTAIELSGKDLDFVQVTVEKTNDRKETFSFKPAKLWMDDQTDKAYVHTSHFAEIKNEVFSEAEAFYKGKYKPSSQQELQL